MNAPSGDERLTVAYIRVSTEEQALRGYSLPEQEDQCRAYARAKQWDELARVYPDEGVSGTTRDRNGLTQLLSDARAGKIARVIFTRLDRLARTAKLIPDLDD